MHFFLLNTQPNIKSSVYLNENSHVFRCLGFGGNRQPCNVLCVLLHTRSELCTTKTIFGLEASRAAL